MITHYRPLYADVVDVYWNKTRLCYSIRPRSSQRVCDYTDSIMLDKVEFIVNEAGRQRVLRTGKNEPHAWVSGHILGYKSLTNGSGLTPLGIFPLRDLTVRKVVYDPYKYNMFVRATKTYEPVVLADQACFSTYGEGKARVPICDAYRKDMWGEFSDNAKPCYELMCEMGWAKTKHNASSVSGYGELERAGIIWSQEEDKGMRSWFWSTKTVSHFDPHVIRFGPVFNQWGFVDETDYYHHGYMTEGAAYNAMIDYAEKL